MKFDELRECSRCGSDACYRQEISKDVSIELCYGCGFQSNSIMKKGSKFFNEQWELLPELYKVLMDEEEDNGKIWMPSHINVKEKGMIFATGNGRSNWRWGAVKSIPVSKEEKEKYKGEEYKSDMSSVKYFMERDFMEALSYIGIIPE